MFGCTAFFVFGSILTIIPEPHYYTFSSAIFDLTNGSALAYKTAWEERIAVFLDKPKEIVEIEAIEVQPELLYFSDITEDAQDWTNRGVARFYDLKSVVLRGDK